MDRTGDICRVPSFVIVAAGTRMGLLTRAQSLLTLSLAQEWIYPFETAPLKTAPHLNE